MMVLFAYNRGVVGLNKDVDTSFCVIFALVLRMTKRFLWGM